MAAIRDEGDEAPAATSDIAFETVADEVFKRYARNWKPSTLKVNRGYYRNHILPWFEGRPTSGITARDVRRWFASLHNTPVAADCSAPVLSVIMRQAEVYGYRPEGTNPCVGLRRYRRQGVIRRAILTPQYQATSIAYRANQRANAIICHDPRRSNKEAVPRVRTNSGPALLQRGEDTCIQLSRNSKALHFYTQPPSAT